MLSDLIYRLSQVLEYKTNNAETRVKTLSFINAAGRELWNTSDLPGSVMEQTFEFDRTLRQVSLPWYVDQIRAMRRRNTGTKVIMQDLRPRYHHSPWRQPYNTFRIRGKTPLLRPLAAASQLTATLGAAETEPLTVTLIGQTSVADRTRQQLSFLPGATTHTSSLQFTTALPFGVTDIVKSRRTLADVTVTDATGATVAIIPASALRASNTIVTLTDYDNPSAQIDDTIDVLFKLPYPELFNDEDTFASSTILEDAIYWMARSHYSSSMTDEFSGARAVAEKQNAMQLIRQFVENMETDAEHMIQTSPNRFSPSRSLGLLGAIPTGNVDYYSR